jgi:hypothetical protein
MSESTPCSLIAFEAKSFAYVPSFWLSSRRARRRSPIKGQRYRICGDPGAADGGSVRLFCGDVETGQLYNAFDGCDGERAATRWEEYMYYGVSVDGEGDMTSRV